MTHHRTSVRHQAAAALAGGLALLAAPFAAYIATTWYRYGRSQATGGGGARNSTHPDRFMPAPAVDERHEIDVDAPASFTFDAACEMDLNRSPIVRAIFALRTLPARLQGPVPQPRSAPLLTETQSLGWRILAQTEHEVVVGAVTQPWRAHVKFRGLDPDAFAGFAEPGFAKIVWTLEAEPLGAATSRFRTRTRVSTTDPRSRTRFRRYWAFVSPGIRLIRLESLRLVKAEAERRFRAAATTSIGREGGAGWLTEGLIRP